MASWACSNIGWRGGNWGAGGAWGAGVVVPGKGGAWPPASSWPRYCWYRLEPKRPEYGLEDFSIGGPLVMVGLELLLGEQGGDSFTLAGGSSSFLMSEVMSNPLKGFWSEVLLGELSFRSSSWLGLRAGLGRSGMKGVLVRSRGDRNIKVIRVRLSELVISPSEQISGV